MTGLAAIIPAAGLSSRMGRFKPLLPLGGGTVLSRCIGAFAGTVEKRIVVTGKRADEVAAEAVSAGAMAVHNPAFEEGMFSSIQTGVRALDDSVRAFFVLPADIPLVRPETAGRIAGAFWEATPPVLYPVFAGKRGHPPLVSRELIPEILAHDGTGGLRAVLERHDSGALDLDVADFGTTHDLDYPQDYELAVQVAEFEGPLESECRVLWKLHGVAERVLDHCRAVSVVAAALAERLNARQEGAKLDPVLVRGAALTHDIGKGTRRHEAAGAEILHLHGFHAAAEIVAVHSDLSLAPDAPTTEREVVFLADKLVRRCDPVALEDRYLEKIQMFGHEPGAEEAIRGRMERAKTVLRRVDREIGCSCEALAREVLR
ncbi:DVU_1551 family NTP transferase [Salidesulfovibrio brasiliensis]|uniref:DVU_1551 family NTP transferase n=1 Tax=Salidesulfovibrio brasiliensis TaxID=221711 RepID=UPI0006D1CBFD|nr:NTP transferase domain-containing protein [Salidesulfovibrio brasiliensis]